MHAASLSMCLVETYITSQLVAVYSYIFILKIFSYIIADIIVKTATLTWQIWR